jgi:hypothetical protein
MARFDPRNRPTAAAVALCGGLAVEMMDKPQREATAMDYRSLPKYPVHDEPAPSGQERLDEKDATPKTIYWILLLLAVVALHALWGLLFMMALGRAAFVM